jgi:peptide/nickel transport system substrate-binding protein
MKLTRRGFAALSAAVLAGRARAAGDTFVSGWGMPANLDPHQIFDVPMQVVMINAYDGLYRYQNDPPEIVPWLAQSHAVSADGLTWEFRLRAGVKFHDGSALTAEDVAYSFRRVLALRLGPAGAFLPVLRAENVTSPDPLTVRFVLSRPYAPFLAAIPIVSIVNPRVVQANQRDGDWGKAWLASNGAGSGAYKIVPATYRPLEALDLEINPDHWMGWEDNKAPVRKVAMRPTAETSTRINALLNGSMDWTDTNFPADQVERVNASKIARVARDTVMRTFLVRMQNQRPPFDNINMRRALAHAFNYPGFINDILGGYATRDPLPMPDQLWGAPKDVAGYDYDLDKAKKYLAAAAKDGAPVKRAIELHYQSENDLAVQCAQMFQADLAQIGVNLKAVPDTWANMTANAVKPESTPDMWVHWVSAYFVDPENWVGQMYDSQFHGTWKASCYYRNDQVDALLREARAGKDQESRAPLYEKAIRQIVADCPDIWVYNSMQLQGIANRVKGRRFCTVGQGCEMRWISIT